MTSRVRPSAALPIAHFTLRVLVVINWIAGAAILALLAVSPNRRWIMQAFKLEPGRDAEILITGLRAIAVLGLGAITINYVILTRLREMVETVRDGDPFVSS